MLQVKEHPLAVSQDFNVSRKKVIKKELLDKRSVSFVNLSRY
jgi:hypothetical protein